MITTHAIYVTTMGQLAQELIRPQWQQERQLLIQLFSDRLSATEAQQWASRILSLYPHATLIGMSSREQIHRGQLRSGGTSLLLSRFDRTGLQPAGQWLNNWSSRLSRMPPRYCCCSVTA